MSKLWLLVGDNYELMQFNEDAPCINGRSNLVLLKDIQLELKKDFKIWTGNCWNMACFANINYMKINLGIRLKYKLSEEKQELLIVKIEEFLNDKKFIFDLQDQYDIHVNSCFVEDTDSIVLEK